MKKKIVFGTLFLSVMTINLFSVFNGNANDISLMRLMQTTKVQAEEFDFGTPMWNVTIIRSPGQSSITCEPGGSFTCPF